MRTSIIKSGLIFCTLALIAGCGPKKINLHGVRASMDNHATKIESLQTIKDERQAYYDKMIKRTSTPKAIPYPSMKTNLSQMDRSISDIKNTIKKIDAFKPKMDNYISDKGMISSDNEAEWNAYQNFMAPYSALVGQLNSHSSRFSSADRAWNASLKKYNIGPTSMDAMRNEVSAIIGEITGGVSEMDKEVDANRKALLFAATSGADGAVLVKKGETLGKMEAMLPALKLFSRTVGITEKTILKTLTGDEEIWTGPGMKGSKFSETLIEVRNTVVQYRESKTAFDSLSKDFNAVTKTAEAEVPAK